MRVLFSGFEVFSNHENNPSSELMNTLEQQKTHLDFKTIILPVSYQQSYEKILTEITLFQPELIVATGLAQKRSSLGIEKKARNLMDCSLPDNLGVVKMGESIASHAPAELSSNLSYDSLTEALEQSCLAWEFSDDAGTYVCNTLFFQLLQSGHKAVFIHLPYRVDLDVLAKALLRACESWSDASLD